MQKIWFKSRRKEWLTKYIEKILKKWQLAMKRYQKKTYDIGYLNTEKTNFGFFLWGCAQLKIPFLLEPSVERKYRGRKKSSGRVDGMIRIGDTEIVFEVKLLYCRLKIESPRPQKKIINIIKLLKKELKSFKWEYGRVKRIGICFLIIERIRKMADRKLIDNGLAEYLENLKKHPLINFIGVYQSDEEIYRDPENTFADRFVYPAVIIIGRYM